MMLGFVLLSRQSGVSHCGPAGVDREERRRAHLRSEERSQALLRQWLSPNQAEQYDRFQRFEVVGSDTGKRYRIRHGTAMNIEELAASGYIARRWCFGPEGATATGDVMLAQKVALETFELNALAIANHDGPLGAECPRRSFLYMDAFGWVVMAFVCFTTLFWLVVQIVQMVVH
jgi:hypothetical protein